MVTPNLHLEHHMLFKLIYRCQNCKPYPLLNHTPCPARSSFGQGVSRRFSWLEIPIEGIALSHETLRSSTLPDMRL